MHPKTRAALDATIARWKAIVYNDGQLPTKDRGCPLCHEFDCAYTKNEWGEKCPIALTTKENQCYGTPYYEWSRKRHCDTKAEAFVQAKKMLDFLYALAGEVSCKHKVWIPVEYTGDEEKELCAGCGVSRTWVREP